MAKKLIEYPEHTKKFLLEFIANAPLQKETAFLRDLNITLSVSPNGELLRNRKKDFPFLKFSIEGTQVILVAGDKEIMRVETAP